MYEVLTEIAARLREAPDALAALTRRRAEASDALHRALEEARRIEVKVAGEVAGEVELGRPKYGNEAARNAEIQRRLAGDQAYQRIQGEVTRLREELRVIDADLELTKARFRSDNNVLFLAACLAQANRLEDAEAVLAAYGAPGTPKGAQEPQSAARTEAAPPQADGLETGVFAVLEARTTGTGAVRAYCQGADGAKVAVYGKNGTGKALSGAVGKRVQVRFRRGDKGLIAVDVRPVA